jgi:hypothetical protein
MLGWRSVLGPAPAPVLQGCLPALQVLHPDPAASFFTFSVGMSTRERVNGSGLPAGCPGYALTRRSVLRGAVTLGYDPYSRPSDLLCPGSERARRKCSTARGAQPAVRFQGERRH